MPERFPYRARRRIEGSLPIGFRGNTVGALWTCALIALPGRADADSEMQ